MDGQDEPDKPEAQDAWSARRPGLSLSILFIHVQTFSLQAVAASHFGQKSRDRWIGYCAIFDSDKVISLIVAVLLAGVPQDQPASAVLNRAYEQLRSKQYDE